MNSIGDKCTVGSLFVNNKIYTPSVVVPTYTYGTPAAPVTTSPVSYVSGFNKYIVYARFTGSVGSPISSQSFGLNFPTQDPFANGISVKISPMLLNSAIASGFTLQGVAEYNQVDGTCNIDATFNFSPALTTSETIKFIIEVLNDSTA